MATAPPPAKRRSMSLDPSTVHRKQLTVTIIEAKAVAPKKEAGTLFVSFFYFPRPSSKVLPVGSKKGLGTSANVFSLARYF
jgi:hypothetical protein